MINNNKLATKGLLPSIPNGKGYPIKETTVLALSDSQGLPTIDSAGNIIPFTQDTQGGELTVVRLRLRVTPQRTTYVAAVPPEVLLVTSVGS